MTKCHCTGGSLDWAADDHHRVPRRIESRRHILAETVLQQIHFLVAFVNGQEAGRCRLGARGSLPRLGTRSVVFASLGLLALSACTFAVPMLILYGEIDTLPDGILVEMSEDVVFAHIRETAVHLARGVQPFRLHFLPGACLCRGPPRLGALGAPPVPAAFGGHGTRWKLGQSSGALSLEAANMT